MASSKRYSEADRRGRNSNQDVTNIGVAGRRTGLRVEGARRGSDGFENESAFFSPTTTAKKAPRTDDMISSARRSPVQSATRVGNSGSFRSMDLEESSAQDVTSALKRRGSELPRSPYKSASRRIDSPTKTHLNSPALRVRNSAARASPPKSALRSPGRPAQTPSNLASKVARRLDFNRTDPDESSDGDVLAAPSDAPAHLGSSTKVSARRPRRSTTAETADEMADAPVETNVLQDDDDDDVLPDVVTDAAREDNDDDDEDFTVPQIDEPEPQFDEFLQDDALEQELADAEEEEPPIAQSPPVRGRGRPKKSQTNGTVDKQDARSVSTESNEDADAERQLSNPRKRGRPAKKPAAKRVARTSQSRDRRERSVRTASPQRKWVEPVPHDTPNDDDAGEGIRKSSRFKIAPLAFWRGEKLVYGRGSRRKSIGGTIGLTMPEVKEVIHVEEGEKTTTARTTTKRASGRGGKRRGAGRIKQEYSSDSDSDDDDDDDEWEEKTKIEAPVRSFENPGEIVKKLLGLPVSAYDLREVVGQGIFFQKTLSEEPHFAAGVLDIPVGAGKPTKPSKLNTMFFFIFTGYVEIRIADNVFRLRKGGQFTIPRGNTYEIRNCGKKDARLFFSQSTDTLANHMINHPESILPEEE